VNSVKHWRLNLRSKMSFSFAIVCTLVATLVKLIGITASLMQSPSNEDVINVLERHLKQGTIDAVSLLKKTNVEGDDFKSYDGVAYAFEHHFVDAFSESDDMDIFIPSISRVDLIAVTGQEFKYLSCKECNDPEFTQEHKKGIAEGNSIHYLDTLTEELVIFIPVKNQSNLIGLVKVRAFVPSFRTLPLDYILWSQLSDLPLILLLSLLLSTLFGFFMSRNIVIRLSNLHQASAKWSEGKFGEYVIDSKSDELAELSHHLNGMAKKLEELMGERASNATWEERSRIARDLHDTVKQKMFALQLQLSAAEQALEQRPDKLAGIIESSIMLSQQSRDDLGAAINALRPMDLNDSSFTDVIESYIEPWGNRTGISVDLSVHDGGMLELNLEDALYKILQEALTNIEKHSKATKITVVLSVEPDKVLLIVKDNGHGVEPQRTRNGHGLRNMKERVEYFGGKFKFDSKPNKGTCITIELVRKG